MTADPPRIERRDAIIALVLVALGCLLMYLDINSSEAGVDVSVFALPAFLLVTVPSFWRRQAPELALGAVFGGLLVHWLLFGTDVTRCGAAFPVVAVIVFAAAAHRERREALICLALGVLDMVLMGVTDHVGPEVLPLLVPLTAVSWGLGRVTRSRARLAGALETRNEELRVARNERARLEVATDRARLSGELDALLQQRLGELAQLAETGAATSDTATSKAALADIEQTSRRTLEQMRELVGALRHGDGAAPTAPQPTLLALEALVVHAKGTDAQLTVAGDPRALTPGVELSAYRIVEHLLESLDDTPGVVVAVHFGDDALELTVSGAPARRGAASAAIERARERVVLHRGTLEARTSGGRAEAVAHLPVIAGL